VPLIFDLCVFGVMSTVCCVRFLPTSASWRQQDLFKLWCPFTEVHGISAKSRAVYILTAMKTKQIFTYVVIVYYLVWFDTKFYHGSTKTFTQFSNLSSNPTVFVPSRLQDITIYYTQYQQMHLIIYHSILVFLLHVSAYYTYHQGA
jgi:hypothetical protein